MRGDCIGNAGLDYEWKQTDRNDLEYGKQGWSSLVGFSLVELEWTKVSFPHEELLDHLLGLGRLGIQFGPVVRWVVYLPVFTSLQWGKDK